MQRRIPRFIQTVLCFLLITVFLVESALSSVVTVKADSMDRVSTFLNMAAGKNAVVDSIDDLDLTEDNLRFLGIFLSNFYIPFGTELGTSADESEVQNQMIDILQTNLMFDDAVATTIVDVVTAQARASSKELKIARKRGDSYTILDSIPANYYTFLCCMTGGFQELLKNQPSDKRTNQDIKELASSSVEETLYFVFTNESGEIVPAYDFSLIGEDLTPSSGAFLKCLEAVNIEKGYGFSFSDITEDEMATSKAEYSAFSDSATNEEAYKLSIYGSTMCVDAFGDLIINGGAHQYVAVPGCLNPYTWTQVFHDGSEGKTGILYNMINIPSFSLAEKGRLMTNVRQTLTSETTNINSNANNNSDEIVKYSPTNTLKNNISALHSNLNAAMSVYESTIKGILDYAGGSSVDKEDVTVDIQTKLSHSAFITIDSVTISGKASKFQDLQISGVSKATLEKRAKSTDSGVKKRAKNQLSRLETLEKAGITNNDLVAMITSLVKSSKSAQLENDTSTATNTQATTNNVLNANLDITDIKGKLGSNASAKLRFARGNAKTDISSNALVEWIKGFVSNNGLVDFVHKSENGLKSVYNDTYYYDIDVDANHCISIPKRATVADRTELAVADAFIFIDNLGAYHFDETEDAVSPELLNVAHYQDLDIQFTFQETGFNNMFQDIKSGEMLTPSACASPEAYIGIYATYLASAFSPDTAKELGFTISSKLPKMSSAPLKLSSKAVVDMQLTAIKDWIYYLLHPTKGFTYVSTLIKNKLTKLLTDWHNDMVGTSGTGSVSGTTAYKGTMGYVTTPSLSDLPITDTLVNKYSSSIPYIILGLLVIMLFAYILGILTLQKSFFAVLIFSLFLSLPPIVLNYSIDTSNSFASKIYGEKFMYWALVQHQSYAEAIDDKASGESYTSYLRTLYAENSKINVNQGSDSLMVRWQAPKKLASLMFYNDEEDKTNGLFNNVLFKPLINSTYSGESYLDDTEAAYMYRSYIDIANFSRYTHKGLLGGTTQPVASALTNNLKDNWSEDLVSSVDNLKTTHDRDVVAGYCNESGDVSNSGTAIRVVAPLSSSIVSDAYGKAGTVKDLKLGEYVGIHQDYFNFSIPMFNQSSLDYIKTLNNDANKKDPNFDAGKAGYTPEDFSGLASYALMSENPFYYFSWYFYESGMQESSQVSSGYRDMILSSGNEGYFYNTKGNGELKDFVDMRSLFTYVIPYLKQGNDLVREWDDVYGIYIYPGVPTDEGKIDEINSKNDPELTKKYWHNLNVARLYEIYTPWVDIMYDCSYSKPTTVEYLGEKIAINDPINPASYPDERPMIFSKSEMADYGLEVNQLTEVERLILKAEEDMQSRMFKLLNYSNFSDVVLNTAAAMECSFAFNSTFSESSVLGKSYLIYPQTFELSNFSYDAFLRFIISNSTGESMLVSAAEDENAMGFYERVVSKSSITTAIVLIVLDFIAVYAVPGIRILTVILLFILLILLVLSYLVKVDNDCKFISALSKSFIKPLILFLSVSLGMSFIVSLFMGEANTAVTGETTPSVHLGDPVVVMILMVLLNITVIILYLKIVKILWADVKKSAMIVGAFIASVVGGMAGKLSNGLKSISNKIGGSRGNQATGGGGGTSSSGGQTQGSESAVTRSQENTTLVHTREVREKDTTSSDSSSSSNSNDVAKNFSKNKKSSKEETFGLSEEEINSRTKEGMNKIKDTEKDSTVDNSKKKEDSK